MINKVILVGRLTKDPELKKTPNNTSVCQFTIACERAYSSQNGEKQADFIYCVAWKTVAENLVKYMRKGSIIGVDGNLEVSNYEDANGQRKSKTHVNANTISFIHSQKQENQTNDTYQNQNNQKQPQKQQTPEDFMSGIDNNEISNPELDF